MKVLTRNGIRANAALSSEVCAGWRPYRSTPPPFRPRFSQREHVQTGSSGSAEPQSLRVDVSFHRFQRHVFGGSPGRFPCIADEAVTVGVPGPALQLHEQCCHRPTGRYARRELRSDVSVSLRRHSAMRRSCRSRPGRNRSEMSERHAGSRNSASSHWAGKLLSRSSR